MKPSRPWIIGIAACGLGAVALAAWPLPQGAEAPEKALDVYRGPEHQTLEVAARGGAPAFRLSTSEEPAAAATASAAPVLVGIVGGREAYLKSTATGEITRVRAGGFLDGWRVAGVDVRSATVVLGSERRRLTLFERSDPPTASPAPGAPQGG